MSSFAAIDFETANNSSNSACQLGIVIVRDWRIVDEAEWLIRPPRMFFSPQCVRVHGITARNCIDAPTWNTLWQDIVSRLEGMLVVGHNIGFDANVFLGTSLHYDLIAPSLELQCSRLIAKRCWPSLNGHGLASVANMLGIQFQHHNALEDARASAMVVIEAASKLEAETFESLEERLGLIRGRIWVDRVRNPRTIRVRRTDVPIPDSGRVEPRTYRADGIPNRASSQKGILLMKSILDRCGEQRPLKGKYVFLIGSLLGLERDDAIGFLTSLGAIVQSSITLQTQFVISGSFGQFQSQPTLFSLGAELDQEQSKAAPQFSEKTLEEVENRRKLGQPIHVISPRQLMALIPSASEILRG